MALTKAFASEYISSAPKDRSKVLLALPPYCNVSVPLTWLTSTWAFRSSATVPLMVAALPNAVLLPKPAPDTR